MDTTTNGAANREKESEENKEDKERNDDGRISLRLAKSIADLEYLRPVSVEFHNEARFSDIPYSHKKRDDLFLNAIENPKAYALVIAELNGEPVGFAFCTAGEYFVGYGDLITTVTGFYVRKKYRNTLAGGKAAIRMLAGVVKWSEVRNVREVMVHATSGIDLRRTDRFFRRAKFHVVGATYALNLRLAKERGEKKIARRP